jgi:hypothetical protein
VPLTVKPPKTSPGAAATATATATKATTKAKPAGAVAAVGAPKLTAAGLSAAAAAATSAAPTSLIQGPAKVTAAAAVPGVAEAFPLDALAKVDGKGLSGTTFRLDGGSLRGQKLQIRRVVDDGKPGFELVFQLTEGKLPALITRAEAQGAKPTGVDFRSAELDSEGRASLGPKAATLEPSGTHAPPDLGDSASAWALALTDPKGARVSVVRPDAAMAVRGLVRIQLSGDDAQCTEQLKAVVQSLGLHHLLAPPTPKATRTHLLMRALWQADHAAAQKLSQGDLDKLKPEAVEAALTAAGYTAERVAGLRYEEVFPGHFTAVDPVQEQAMIEAGARYLYSTVTSPEHVHSILQHGQKSSLQRYKDGLIIDGMSTSADFVTGGAVGVFTRLVTQDAIYSGESWMGRTYKLVQSTAQLGRTDWYGWDGDYFGRRWELETKSNFGPALVKKIDHDGYQSANELIFTAGNRPQSIQRVVATSEADRDALVKHLEAQGYTPHNGLSLAEFVVLAPQFLAFGPSPYAGTTDLPGFTEAALAEVKAGKPGKLQWLLFEGPITEARAPLEQKLLLSGPEKARKVLLDAVAYRGAFTLAPSALDAVITQLTKGAEKQQAIAASLVERVPEALFRAGTPAAVALLRKHDQSGSYQPYGLSDDAWVRIIGELAKGQAPDKPRSKALQLALETRAEQLLEYGHAGFKALLAAHPLVKPSSPDTWLTDKLAAVKKNGSGKLELALYVAQLTDPAAIGALQLRLLQADGKPAAELLGLSTGFHGKLHIAGPALLAAIEALPAGSPTRAHVLEKNAAELLETASPVALAMLQAKYSGPYEGNMGIYDAEVWRRVVTAQLGVTGGQITDVVRSTIEAGADSLMQDTAFRAQLASMPALYTVGDDPAAFAEHAATHTSAKDGGLARIGWMLFGPQANTLRLPAMLAALRSDDYQVRQLLSTWEGGDTKFLATPAELRTLVASLDGAALDALLSSAGRDVLRAADEPTLEKLRQHFTGKDDASMSSFGMYGAQVVTLLKELDARGEAGAGARQLVMDLGAAGMIQQSDTEFLAYLQAQGLDYGALGKDAAWAAAQVKQLCDDQSYYWTEPAYAGNAELTKLPAGAAFLLRDEEGHYDAAVLAQIVSELPGWGWNKKMFAAFVKSLDELPETWSTQLAAAQAKKKPKAPPTASDAVG